MFDSLKYAKELEAVGVSREQAEAHIHIIAEIVEGELATKQDIQKLDLRLEGLSDRFENKLVELEYRLVVKICTVVGAMITLAIAVIAALAKIFN